VAGFGNTIFEILYAPVANGHMLRIKLCTPNWKKPSPTARPSLQVTMEDPMQHIWTRAAFKPIWQFFS